MADAEPQDQSEQDQSEQDLSEQDQQTREWWQDPSLPWKHKPGRADLICLGLMVAIGIFAWAMIPGRAYLIAHNPLLLVGLTGSRSGMVTLGALSAVGRADWLPALALGIPSLVKFDLVYFWAGKLWGDGFLRAFAGQSKRAARRAERTRRLALRYAVPAVLLSYLPIPIPSAVIYATVAAAGMTWRKFIVVNLCAAAVMQSLYLYLGYRIGAPAVELVDTYARYSGRVALIILVLTIGFAFWRNYSRKSASATPES